MTRLLASTAIAAIALAAATTAQAQTEWTGPYVGAQVGLASADDDAESVEFDTNLDGQFGDTVNTTAPANAFSPGFCSGSANTNAPGGGCSEDDEATEFGLRAGYDWQFGRFVIGGVAEVSMVDIEDSVSAFSTTPASYTLTRQLDYIVGIRGRVGVAFDPVLVYATGGPAYAKIESSFSTTNGANAFTERGDDDGVWGYQLGLGAEWRVNERWSLGAEWMFSSFEDDSYRVRASQGSAPATNPFILVNTQGTDFRRSDSDFEVQSFRLTAAWRF